MMFGFEILQPAALTLLLPKIGQQSVDVAAMLDLPMLVESLELRETFPVWKLQGALVGDDLEKEAFFTERWHHQILMNDAPKLAAVTRRAAGEQHLDQVSAGPYVANIQTALGFLAGHREIRVLHLPYYGLQALWAIDGNPAVAPFGQIGVVVPAGAVAEAIFVAAVKLAPAVQGFSACP